MRAAVTVAIYSTFRTSARPPQIMRRPRCWPLSRANGATPVSAAIARRLSVPNSGNRATKVATVTRPTPGALVNICSLVFQRLELLSFAVRSMSSRRRRSLSHSMCSLMSWRAAGVACVKRVFSSARIVTNCLRRSTRSISSRRSSSGNGRTGGCTFWANPASTKASIRSVLARIPKARAKSRTCLGLTTASAKPRAANAVATFVSKPPVASITINSGASGTIHAHNCSRPAQSLPKRRVSRSGKQATSSHCFETSIPMKRATVLSFPTL
jgi:hypothetical protein